MDILTPVLARLCVCSEADMRALSARSGVPLGTIARIKYLQTRNPRVDTVQRLYRAMFAQESQQLR